MAAIAYLLVNSHFCEPYLFSYNSALVLSGRYHFYFMCVFVYIQGDCVVCASVMGVSRV